jgi:predicted transcriptional regulator
MTKTLTVRLDAERAAELEAIARADHMPVNRAVGDAIERHIAARRKDKDFQARLKQMIEEEREVLDRLAQ